MKPPPGRCGVGARETSDPSRAPTGIPRQYTHNRDSTVTTPPLRHLEIFHEKQSNSRQNLVKTCFVTGTTASWVGQFAKGSVESTHKVPTSHYHTKHCEGQ